MREDPVVDYLMALDSGTSARGREKRSGRMLALPAVRALVRDVSIDPWPPINSHRSAQHPLHKLSFLAELGASGEELGVEGVLDRIIASVGGRCAQTACNVHLSATAAPVMPSSAGPVRYPTGSLCHQVGQRTILPSGRRSAS